MKLLNAEQIAEQIGCSESHARVIMHEMHPVNIGAGKINAMWRVKPQELEQWIERRSAKLLPETLAKARKIHPSPNIVLIDGKLPNSRQRKLLGLSER